MTTMQIGRAWLTGEGVADSHVRSRPKQPEPSRATTNTHGGQGCPPLRRRAGLVLELALMLVLAALLSRCTKGK